MKKRLLASLFLTACQPTHTQEVMERTTPLSANPQVVIIYVDATRDRQPLLKALKQKNAEVLYQLQYISAVVAKLPESASLESDIKQLSDVEGVLSVQPDQVMQLH